MTYVKDTNGLLVEFLIRTQNICCITIWRIIFSLKKDLISWVFYFCTKNTNRERKKWGDKNLERVKVSEKDVSLFVLCQFVLQLYLVIEEKLGFPYLNTINNS